MRVLDTGFDTPPMQYGYEWGGSILHKRKNFFLTATSDINNILDHVQKGNLDFSHENEDGFWFRDAGLGWYVIHKTQYAIEIDLKVVNNTLTCKRFQQVTSLS